MGGVPTGLKYAALLVHFNLHAAIAVTLAVHSLV